MTKRSVSLADVIHILAKHCKVLGCVVVLSDSQYLMQICPNMVNSDNV